MSEVLQRVLDRVTVSDSGCWEFQGNRIKSGYGRASWNGRLWLTHRLVYTTLVGPIPDGLEIDHLCRNPPCCNPTHLEPVTRSENIRRGLAPTRTAERQLSKTECPEGHPYDETNTYRTTEGHRQCRACKKAASDRYSEQNRELIAARAHAYRARRAAGTLLPPPAERTHCPRGHAYDEANTYWTRRGSRCCRACRREDQRRRRALAKSGGMK